MKLRRYRCFVKRLDTEAYFEAVSHAKARWKCLLAIWEAGYDRRDRKPSALYPAGTKGFSFRDIRVTLSD